MQEMSADLKRLEYYQRREAQRTFYARALLLSTILGMLGANMFLTWQTHEDMLTNMDQARLEQSQLIDAQAAVINEMGAKMATMEAQVDMMEAQTASTAEMLASR
ncbi:MAG: hypothetical protein GY884_21950 [Proteobacteria bacterium]|nr:hypothetical protein [Pseudomonadota bacterium]